MSSIIYTEPQRVSDVIYWEVNSTYCRDAGTFKNNTGSTLATVPIGQVLLYSGGFWVPANVNDADGILLTKVENIANNGTTEVAVLARGPALVYQDQLDFEHAATDPSGDPTVAAQLAALASLQILTVQDADRMEEAS